MSGPTCRSCAIASLPEADRQRVAQEPITGTIYLCPGHQATEDKMLSNLPLKMFQRKTGGLFADDESGPMRFPTIEEIAQSNHEALLRCTGSTDCEQSIHRPGCWVAR